MAPLLEELRKLGTALPPSSQPNVSESNHVLAAVVRVLEHLGVTVAEELYPEELPSVIVTAAPVVTDAEKAILSFAARMEAALAKLEGAPPPSAEAPAQSPAQATPAPSPSAEVPPPPPPAPPAAEPVAAPAPNPLGL